MFLTHTDLVTAPSSPTTPRGQQSLSDSHTRLPDPRTLLSVALDVEVSLSNILKADWGVETPIESVGLESYGGYDSAVELLVRDMWRSAAAVNMLCKDTTVRANQYLHHPQCHPQRDQDAVVIRIVQLLCIAPSVCYSTQVMDCLVAVLQWLLVSNPSLRTIVSSEVTLMFLDTAKRGLGLFSHNGPEAPGKEGKSLLSAGSYSERLIDFISDPAAAEALRDKSDCGRKEK